MDVRSSGVRTDLMLRAATGEVVHADDLIIVRTPSNPTFRWGNYVVFPGPPGPGDVDRWIDRFHAEVGAPPTITHVALTWDSDGRSLPDLTEFVARGFEVEVVATLSCDGVAPPSRPDAPCEIREFRTDGDWEAWVELAEAQNAAEPPESREGAGHREFAIRMARDYRALVDSGLGRWFGAFVSGQLAASMGLFVSDGLGRFQVVDTHPGHRRRGLATTLLRHAMRTGFDEMGARELVILADVDDVAIGIYRTAGFVEREHLVELTLVDRTNG